MKKVKIIPVLALTVAIVLAGILLVSDKGMLQGFMGMGNNKIISKDNQFLQVTPKKKPKKPFIVNLKCAVVNTYEEILDCYNSMNGVEAALGEMRVGTVLGGSVSGRSIVFHILNSGYDGLADNETKEDFFDEELATYFFNNLGQRDYLIRVAHSIWLEKSGLVPWSLKDYSNDQISLLFWVRLLHLNELPPVPIDEDYRDPDPVSDPFAEQVSWKLFNLSKQFLANSTSSTVENVIRWEKKNFFHAYYDYGWDVYGEGGHDEVSNINLDDLFEERVVGCHLSTLVLENMLRSLNIPAINIHFGHSLVYLPTLDKYIHGDHIADFAVVPVEDMLLTAGQMEPILAVPEDYSERLRNVYNIGDRMHAITNTELHRQDDNLLLETDSVCFMDKERVFEIMGEEVPEFNVQFNADECLISSDLVPIRTLEELSGD